MGVDTGERTDKYAEERARVAVLEVTTTMLGEVGYQKLRPAAVAARAGIPRSWLRRWWTTRPLLVAEAVHRMGGPPEIVPTGDVRTDVRAIVLRTAAFLANPVVGDAIAGLNADATRDPVAAERLAALLAARRAGDAAVLLSATARGDLRPDTDVPLLLDVVFGTLLFRLGRGAPPTPAVVDMLVELLLSGQGADPGAGADPWSDESVDDDARDGYELDGQGPDGFRLGGQRLDGDTLEGAPPHPKHRDTGARTRRSGAEPQRAEFPGSELYEPEPVRASAAPTASLDAAMVAAMAEDEAIVLDAARREHRV